MRKVMGEGWEVICLHNFFPTPSGWQNFFKNQLGFFLAFTSSRSCSQIYLSCTPWIQIATNVVYLIFYLILF